MPMATIHKVGTGELYHIHFLDQRTDPDYGRPGYGGGHPDHDLPGRPNRPDQGLPGTGAHPGNRPPGSAGGIPDNELPDHAPPQLAPGYTLVLIRHDGQWVYAAIAPGSPPPRPLPNPPEHVGGRPPGMGRPDRPDQGLPGGPPATGPGSPNYPTGGPVPPPNYPTGQPVPPTGTPTAR